MDDFLFVDSDAWYEEFTGLSPKDKYDFMLKTLEQPLSEDFFEHMDFGEILLDFRVMLENHKLHEEILTFVEKFKVGKPDLYKKEYFYYDPYVANYYLYTNQPEKVKEALAMFILNPVPGIDFMIPLLNSLIFYGQTDLAVFLSENTYQEVDASSSLIGGAEFPLVNTLYVTQVEQVYRMIQDGQIVDWEDFFKQAEKLGFEYNEKDQQNIKEHLAADRISPKSLVQILKKHGFDGLSGFVCFDFCRYMLLNKNMLFISSTVIWDEFMELWQELSLSFPEKNETEKLFIFSEKDLEGHLAEMMISIFSSRETEAIALLWGIPYIYEYLLARNIISEQLCRNILQITSSIKEKVVKVFAKELWKYGFVHSWNRPDGISEESFANEVEAFKSSFTDAKPLEDVVAKPVNRGFTQMSMFDDVQPKGPTGTKSSAKNKKDKPKKSSRNVNKYFIETIQSLCF